MYVFNIVFSRCIWTCVCKYGSFVDALFFFAVLFFQKKLFEIQQRVFDSMYLCVQNVNDISIYRIYGAFIYFNLCIRTMPSIPYVCYKREFILVGTYEL